MTTTPRSHRIDIQVRFGDTDAMGHLNNTSFAYYAEVARLEFVAQFGEEVRSLILAHLAIDFRRQVRFGEAVAVETQIERLGTSSITLRQRIVAGGALAADVRSVVVFFDYAEASPKPLTAALRAALEPYVIANAAGTGGAS
jgi:acyl-CoA thioester hydrolase